MLKTGTFLQPSVYSFLIFFEELFYFFQGDCCLPVVDTSYCTKCICKDEPITTSEPKTTMDNTISTTMEQTSKVSVNPGCPYPEYVGDGFCDDATNKEICEYDGGDCCTIFVNVEHCRTCICHEDGRRHAEIGMTTTAEGPCPIQHYVGDGFCDDETNVLNCGWDGGDCCLEDTITYHCTECFCKGDPNGQE